MITLPSRRRISPYLLTTAIESEESILQYRIVQTAPDVFRIDAIVRAPGLAADVSHQLSAELVRLIGEPVRFEVQEVAALKRDPSGKRSAFQRAIAGCG